MNGRRSRLPVFNSKARAHKVRRLARKPGDSDGEELMLNASLVSTNARRRGIDLGLGEIARYRDNKVGR